MVTLSAGILTPDLLGLCQALSLLTFSPTLAVNNRRFGPSPSPRLLSVQANRQSETSMGCLPEGEAVLTRPMSFKEDDIKVMGSFRSQKGESDTLPTPKSSNKPVFQQSPSFNYWGPEKNNEANFSFTPSLEAAPQSGKDTANRVDNEVAPAAAAEVPLYRLLSPRPKPELDEFATKVQKVYKSYRTRRNLADAAVVVEELWWKALDYASLNISSVSFYHNDGKPEKAVSRWSRAKKRLAKVGKGLSQDEKAQKLAIQHWLEAIDPRHRYGHNLHLYYENWRDCKSTQPFFYWLDVGEGQEVDLKVCPRSRLQSQIIKYLGPTERESYEVVVVNGRLFYKTDQLPLNTTKDSKWIFVLSTSRILYVGQKKKGTFQHSSFLSGAAIIAAGRLIAEDGYVKRIWRHSGHYHPTEENLSEFMAFLTGSHVDLSGVKISGTDNDDYCDNVEITSASTAADMVEARAPTPKWCTGTGPRIGCVRDYPVDLQVKALEQVRLSPRIPPSPVENNVPIPSPRPSPKLRISPHLSRMGFSPRTYPADLRSPVVKSSPKTSFAGFPQPKVTLRLPSSRGRKCR